MIAKYEKTGSIGRFFGFRVGSDSRLLLCGVRGRLACSIYPKASKLILDLGIQAGIHAAFCWGIFLIRCCYDQSSRRLSKKGNHAHSFRS